MEVPNLLSLGKADDKAWGGEGGVGGQAEGEENLVYGLLTSQCPIVPAWRIGRIKSKLVYVSTSLSDISPNKNV